MQDDDYYISRDEIRFDIVGEDEDYFSHEVEVFDRFINEINEALEGKERVFADASHLNPASRAKVVNRLIKKPDEINVIWLRTPLMECYKRNENREGRAFVPKSVIKSMYDSIQEPTAKEGINTVYIIDGKSNELKVLELGKNNKENFIF